MSATSPIPQQLANACKAMGDPLRLAIVQLLGSGSFGVLELCELFDIKQSSMSHHLKILAQAQVLSNQREGNSIFYRRPLLTGNDDWQRWLRSTFVALDQSPMSDELQQRLQQLLASRADACAEFFARNAEAFKQQQDLIASYDQYGATLQRLVEDYAGNKRIALEIGPGDGDFLAPLARQFEQVTALDISEPMLNRAMQRVNQLQLTNVNCVLGETALLDGSHNQTVDFVAANMVLHHVPVPQTIFADVARLLAPQGCFLVTDLCRHEQSWARESCGDLWLGFEPDDLTAWAEEVGLTEGQSQFLGLRNGFQIQLRLFYR
ncbi:ArsR/SmtB family transcription factor [Oceanobacter mangrovi]|uniref:ArsR/SmtB family transcription factor n=1 Tax=Oceanobacter mangrovi TaxID=2862510 RepID=UPI001C8EF1F6|nr:metalloregulator ArsR/SmtB family transcription factor [Oceanobacter mangrovi]